MRYKGKRGSRYVFDQAYGDYELDLLQISPDRFVYENVIIDRKLNVSFPAGPQPYNEIQVAVNLVMILLTNKVI